jgi:hypothetical protein
MSQAVEIALPKNATPLDAAMYLAMLVSKPEKVDPILDTVREITARQGSTDSTSLSETEQKQLQEACNKLATYLTTEEQLRGFTQEDLERRLQERFERTGVNRRWGLKLLIIIGGGLALGLLSLLIQPPQPIPDPKQLITFHILLAIPTAFTVISLGAAWFFFSALKHFKTELRKAYIITALGISLLGVAHMQMPIIGYINEFGGAWIHDGAVGVVYTPAHILIWIGSVIFALLIGAQSRFNTWPVLLAVCMAGVLFTVLYPHSPAQWSEKFFDFATGTFPIAVTFSTGAAINFYMISRRINDIFRKPLRWLGHANMLLAVSVGHILIIRLVFTYANFWVDYGLIMLPYFLASLAALRAGYLFNRVSHY